MRAEFFEFIESDFITVFLPKYFREVLKSLAVYKGLGFAVIAVIIIWIIYKLATRPLRKYIKAKTGNQTDNYQNFFFVWRYGWLAFGAILAVLISSGSIAALGISAAFLGLIMGWSLQAPVTGIAAWLMIILKRPFRIGDRVVIAGIIGDVVDITLTHVVLNQVGGTVGGEEKSGRGVLVPNAILFQQIILNYSFTNRYILDEVTVMITYNSDVDKAEAVLLQAVHETAGDAIKATNQEPFTRTEFADSGLRMRIRYQTLGTRRQDAASKITRKIISLLKNEPAVEIAYPHTEIIYKNEK